MGWDAAWTPHGSGAWCILEERNRMWVPVEYASTPQGRSEMKRELNRLIKEWSPSLIAIDMPVADEPVTGYREADRATTRAFSRFGCPVHSPTPQRPGGWGEFCVQILHEKGYRCKTGLPLEGLSFVEVYPHTALLKLLRLSKRFPYKISRASRYWPEGSPAQRKEKILQHFEIILEALAQDLEMSDVEMRASIDSSLREIKQVEDHVDAFICAWSALQIRKRQFRPFGNPNAAIWNPMVKELDLMARSP